MRWTTSGLVSALAITALFAGASCVAPTHAVPAASTAAVDPAGLDQGWRTDQREAWYGATQGSRLIPLDWLRALEQPSGTGMFLDPAYIESFRYIPRGKSLPVGFTVDDQDDSNLLETRLRWKAGQGKRAAWVGMNCAACHTTKLTYNSENLVIDGGAALSDFQGFLEALNAALAETRRDEAKFDRFAHRVLAVDPATPIKAADLDLLRTAVDKHIAFEAVHAEMNATKTRYGNARLDAFGHIFNKVVLIANRKAPVRAESDAPVSYPFLWNVNQHERVQWNGVAPNFALPGAQPYDVGGLVRNVGEVTGVFADVHVGSSLRGGYTNSVDVQNLSSMEQLLGKLNPPKWPTTFPKVDPDLVKEGAVAFQNHCVRCHQVLPERKDHDTRIPLQISLFKPNSKHPNSPPGTDRAMACNAAVTTASTGALKGTRVGYFSPTETFKDTAPVGSMLVTVAAGELWNRRWDVVGTYLKSFVGLNPPPKVTRAAAPVSAAPTRRELCDGAVADTLGYKARPLNGIWATAPYLHNGSVPTLYDLLKPPADRPRIFYVGSRRFNPKEVGYVTEKADDNQFLFETRDADGQPKWGNSNEGHDYGNASLKERERWALVEYMKTFGEP